MKNSEKKKRCKKCNKEFDDVDEGFFEETTNEELCYDCAMENLEGVGKSVEKTGRELDALLRRYK